MPFKTDLIVKADISHDGMWIVHDPLEYLTDSGVDIVVPAGFPTDLASIPRIAQSVIEVNGKHRRAAVIHDYLYHFGIGTREDADGILKEAMLRDGVNEEEAIVIYEAVRLGGASHWKS